MKSFAIGSMKLALFTTLIALAAIGTIRFANAATTIFSVTPSTTIDAICRGLGYVLPITTPTPPPSPTPPPTPPPTPTPSPSPTPPPITSGNELRYTAYTTGYAALDNTPPGSTQIDLGGHSGNAGGTGTYANPITLAVGGSLATGKEVDDYPYGTKWYVPNLRKYFVAQDFCGDGPTPQNGPCHTGFQGHPWIDLYVGASLANAVLTCEDSITDLHLVIQNPASNYAVVPGAVYDTGCKQYGDAVVTQ